MFSVLLATLVFTATSAETPNDDYTLAYKKSVEQEKPLVVVVAADWCHACNVLKSTTIKTMEQTGELQDVSFAVVDKDAQPELAEQLLKGEALIPRIIVFSRSQQGKWQREELKGYQPTQPVRSLIKRAVSRVRG